MRPYLHLTKLVESDSSIVKRYSTIEEGIMALDEFTPDLVLLSTAYSPAKTLKLLDALRDKMTMATFIPLIYVMDWTQRLHRVIGVSWGNRIGILGTTSSVPEMSALLDRLSEF